MKPLLDEKKNCTALVACVSLSALGSEGGMLLGTVPLKVPALASTPTVEKTLLSELGRSGVAK